MTVPLLEVVCVTGLPARTENVRAAFFFVAKKLPPTQWNQADAECTPPCYFQSTIG